MRHQKVAVLSLPIERSAGVANTGQAGTCELNKERDTKEHGDTKPDTPPDQGRAPVQNFDASRDSDQHRRNNKEQVQGPTHADGEHMMAPDQRAQHYDSDSRGSNGLVTEDRFTGKDRNHLRDHAECRKNHDVNFRMAESPKDVLPENG